MHGRVVVFGNFVADVIAKPLERLPERGQLLILDTIQTHVGGNAPNTAGALGKLGESVSVGGRVGLDPYGDFLLAQLAGWGVETGPVLRDPEAATGVTLVAVDRTGERSFLHHFGANAAVTAADLNWDMVADASHF
ncbi:MAG: carbohydrate kinase family protein, partial [SAR202 cluster bacterium]|nr:carbohydrate kinase family protein [SAR202 cluster bacterium]